KPFQVLYPVVHHKITSRSPEEGRIFGNGAPLRKTFSIGFLSLPPFKIRSPLVCFQPKVGLVPIFHLLWVFAPEEHTTDSGYSFHLLCFYCVKIQQLFSEYMKMPCMWFQCQDFHGRGHKLNFL